MSGDAQGALLGDILLMDSPLPINTKPIGEKTRTSLPRYTRPSVFGENACCQYVAIQFGTYVFSEARQKASREKLWTPSLFKKTWDHYYSKLP